MFSQSMGHFMEVLSRAAVPWKCQVSDWSGLERQVTRKRFCWSKEEELGGVIRMDSEDDWVVWDEAPKQEIFPVGWS